LIFSSLYFPVDPRAQRCRGGPQRCCIAVRSSSSRMWSCAFLPIVGPLREPPVLQRCRMVRAQTLVSAQHRELVEDLLKGVRRCCQATYSRGIVKAPAVSWFGNGRLSFSFWNDLECPSRNSGGSLSSPLYQDNAQVWRMSRGSKTFICLTCN
jgi:hypothetical protein